MPSEKRKPPYTSNRGGITDGCHGVTIKLPGNGNVVKKITTLGYLVEDQRNRNFIEKPSCQRDLIPNKVERIYKHTKRNIKKNNTEHLMDSIKFIRCNGRMFNIDGQHRLAAYYKLYDDIEDNFDKLKHYIEIPIMIDIIYCDSKTEIYRLYRRINIDRDPSKCMRLDQQNLDAVVPESESEDEESV